MSRFTDFRLHAPVQTLPATLPGINWGAIHHQAPAPVPVDYRGPSANLPQADAVVFTWTDAEWSALDHVFLHGDAGGSRQSTTLHHKWLLFSDSAPPSSKMGGELWGYYQLVEIEGKGSARRRVLLVKSDAHLAHPPWLAGLSDLVNVVIRDVHPQWIYSAGTAG
jgi:hypothetical protein